MNAILWRLINSFTYFMLIIVFITSVLVILINLEEPIRNKMKKKSERAINKMTNNRAEKMEKVAMFEFNCCYPLKTQKEILLDPVKLINIVLEKEIEVEDKITGYEVNFEYEFEIAKFNIDKKKYAESKVKVKNFQTELYFERYTDLEKKSNNLMEYDFLIADIKRYLNHSIRHSLNKNGTWIYINQMEK
jgi:hypothetical protein